MLFHNLWCQDVAKDTKLISEGDLNADYFYIVQSGVVPKIIRVRHMLNLGVARRKTDCLRILKQSASLRALVQSRRCVGIFERQF